MLSAYYSDSSSNRDTRRLLALAFRELYGAPLPRLEKDHRGKPFFPERPDVYFSLSHAKSHVMVAIGDVPCGCDIETVRHVRAGVSERVCSPEELQRFGFFNCWVLKESFIKVLGGADLPLEKLNFSFSDGHIITPSPDISARLYDAGVCRAAVCGRGEPPAELIFVPANNLA